MPKKRNLTSAERKKLVSEFGKKPFIHGSGDGEVIFDF